MLTNTSKAASEPVQGRQASVRWGRTGLLNPHNRLILSVAGLPLSDSLLFRIFYTLRYRFFPFASWSCYSYTFNKMLLSVLSLFSFCIALACELPDI